MKSPHAVSSADTLTELASSHQGLSSDEALKRLSQYGRNQPPERERASALVRFFGHFNNILIYVLLGAAVITALLGHPIDTIVILAVVIANAVIGFIQEGRAEKAMDAIQDMLSPQAAVLRDGQRLSIDSAELVPGDMVLIEAGDRVPADLRLVQTYGVQIEEAALTGESVPAEKSSEAVSADAPLGDRTGMAFSGTLVTAGTGRGVVTATGANTEIGRISGMLSDVETLTTPLLEQMDGFARWLTLFILLVATLVLVFGYFVGDIAFFDIFMAVVGLSVAAIPEGLPAVLTITLAVGVRAMAGRNAIIRRLPAIETLGSVSVICSDKTGTLTRNEMMVTSAITASGAFQIEGNSYHPEGAITSIADIGSCDARQLLGDLALASAMCNDAVLHHTQGSWGVHGDPMEGALLTFAAKVQNRQGAGLADLQDQWSRLDVIPFDARHRFMATLNRNNAGSTMVFVKGAPEQVLAMCSGQRHHTGKVSNLDVDHWRMTAEQLATDGRRVLALASLAFDGQGDAIKHEDLHGPMTMLGLVGLMDPPRPEAIEAVADCQRAGIRVKMITGDHAGTAAAIGREIGLEGADNVLTGTQIDAMDDAVLATKVIDTDVFARTSPEHKLRLVKALQSQGLTVAMTGDGVNDAPALKRADAGVAMGKKGTEAAKEAAEIVLADDNFASIAAAVREGRTVYDNIKKVISWTLPTNGGEALTILLALLLGTTLPITPIQILWINLVTAITLGVALAFEPTEAGTMRRAPRPRDEPILGKELVWHILLVATLFLAGVYGMFAYAINRGYDIELARTLAVNTLVVMEIFHLFFIRNIYGTSLTWDAVKGTRVIWACVIAVVVAQFAITYVPALQTVFGTAAVGLFDGMLIILIGVALFALLELEKQLRLTFSKHRKTPTKSVPSCAN